jgi:hypothetical protein
MTAAMGELLRCPRHIVPMARFSTCQLSRQLANPLHDLRSFFYARLTSDFFLKLGFD